MIVSLDVAFVGCRIEREADVDVGFSWDFFWGYVADDHVVLFIYLVGAFRCHMLRMLTGESAREALTYRLSVCQRVSWSGPV